MLSRGVGTLVVEVPAALWGVGAALLAMPLWHALGPRVPPRGRPVLLLALALSVPWAGVRGTRYEQAGPAARGLAHSGPILGIHPFQTTAILIDGHGPFDLPINDYVEPDGSRGYGPEALADALDRALESIAERVYPQGPHRIRRALIDAEVEAVTTPAVWERLDREPFEDTVPRFVVRSGSFGRGSRVEFVCPGRRIDPRGAQGESVMNKMCPDKYASEASAGLGVTGRWSGYSEQRGNDRVGLHALRGWTRGDDAPGKRILEREIRIWAWLCLALVGLGLLRPLKIASEAPLYGVGGPLGVLAVVLLRPLQAEPKALEGVGGLLGVMAVGGLVVLTLTGVGDLSVSLWPPVGPSWQGWPSPTVWAPALALGSLALFSFERPSSGAGTAEGRGIAVPAVLVVVATLALAAALPALSWALPLHPTEGVRWLDFVRGLANALGERGGLTIFEMEGLVASTLAAILLGGAMATARAGQAATQRLRPGGSPAVVTATAVLAGLAVAAGLVVSRKTAGAAALMPGVIGVILVLASGVLRLGGTRAPTILGGIVHLGWIALGMALVWWSTEALPDHQFVTLCRVVGLAGILAAGLLTLRGSTGSSEQPKPLERDGAARL